MDFIADSILSTFGLDAVAVCAVYSVLALICRAVGNWIPDDAVGWKGYVRSACKVVGLYVANRVTSTVDVNTPARAVLNRVNNIVGGE